jgi:SRSO17 transposase
MVLGRVEWVSDLERWLAPFLVHLSHRARRAMCPLYVAGLIGPGDRKSVQPMAERLGMASHDRLHHFVSSGTWDATLLEAELLVQADRLVGGPEAYLVIDDTALPKKGTRSVGVAHQYASALGKNASCQTLVSLTLARDEVPVAVALRLFLPENWAGDLERLQRAGVPVAERQPRTKPEIALAELDRIRLAGVRFGVVLADAGYGISASFRQALSVRDLVWAVGIPRIQKVFPAEVEMIPPPPARRRSRQPLIPAIAAISARQCWMGSAGARSPGGGAPKARSKPPSRQGACAWRTGRRFGCTDATTSTCQARRSGSWASAAPRASASTTCPTCRQTRP